MEALGFVYNCRNIGRHIPNAWNVKPPYGYSPNVTFQWPIEDSDIFHFLATGEWRGFNLTKPGIDSYR